MDAMTLYAIIVDGREVRGAVRENFGGAAGGYTAGYTVGVTGGRYQAPSPSQDIPVAGPRADWETAPQEPRPSAG